MPLAEKQGCLQMVHHLYAGLLCLLLCLTLCSLELIMFYNTKYSKFCVSSVCRNGVTNLEQLKINMRFIKLDFNGVKCGARKCKKQETRTNKCHNFNHSLFQSKYIYLKAPNGSKQHFVNLFLFNLSFEVLN